MGCGASPASLRAERDHGLQSGGFHGGVHPEDDAQNHGEEERAEDNPLIRP